MLGEQAKSPKRSSFAITPPVTPRRNLSFWLRRKTTISTNRTYRAYGLAPFRKGRIVAGRIAIAYAHAHRSGRVCSEGISLIIIKTRGWSWMSCLIITRMRICAICGAARAGIAYSACGYRINTRICIAAGRSMRAHAQYKSHVYYYKCLRSTCTRTQLQPRITTTGGTV